MFWQEEGGLKRREPDRGREGRRGEQKRRPVTFGALRMLLSSPPWTESTPLDSRKPRRKEATAVSADGGGFRSP